MALPTDTLYGLAADVTNKGALKRVFDIKGRPAELALPVLVANWDQVGVVANVECSAVARLASMFWPGSLTFVLPKQPNLSPLVTGGRETVAVRMPDHWVPLSLASQLGAAHNRYQRQSKWATRLGDFSRSSRRAGRRGKCCYSLGAGATGSAIHNRGLNRFFSRLAEEGRHPFRPGIPSLGGFGRSRARGKGHGGATFLFLTELKPTARRWSKNFGSAFLLGKASCTTCFATTWAGLTSRGNLRILQPVRVSTPLSRRLYARPSPTRLSRPCQ